MRKIAYILKEMWHLMKENKLYVLAPIFLTLAVLAFLVFYIGPAVIVAFIYAGV